MTALPVLIPVNRLDAAKGRLASLLNAEERRTLAMITFEAVLHAAGRDAVILTSDETVAAAARGRATVMDESPVARGLNGQIAFAVAELLNSGVARDRLLILHADLPLATGEAVETLAMAAAANSVVMVRSRDGGTNAMLLSPPGRFPPAYGPGSYQAHQTAARDAGLRVIEHSNRELRLDLDTPDDIRELLRAPRGRQGACGAYLLSIGIETRLGQPV